MSFGLFNSESKATTKVAQQQASGQQSGIGNITAGGNSGVGSSGAGNVGVSTGRNSTVTVNSLDPQVALAALTSNNIATQAAFSTIDHITAAQTLGAEAAALEAGQQSLAIAQGSPSTAGSDVAPISDSGQTLVSGHWNGGGGGGNDGGLNKTYLLLGIAASAAVVLYYLSKGKI